MIPHLPAYVSLLFGATTIATLLLFYRILKNATADTTRSQVIIILSGLVIWLVLQAVLSINQVYNSNTTALPPTIAVLGVSPPLIAIVLLFTTAKGRRFIDSLPLTNLTYLHVVRIPVEIVLWCLFLHKAVPQLMTFEGRNFDILAGITAPLVAYFGGRGRIKRWPILAWNFVGLFLLLNIVVNAFLSAPSPLQKFAFDQPNIAILYFPFSWLPTFIVPVVLFAHLAAIRQLTKQARQS